MTYTGDDKSMTLEKILSTQQIKIFLLYIYIYWQWTLFTLSHVATVQRRVEPNISILFVLDID